jgi:hypothetical protein
MHMLLKDIFQAKQRVFMQMLLVEYTTFKNNTTRRRKTKLILLNFKFLKF